MAKIRMDQKFNDAGTFGGFGKRGQTDTHTRFMFYKYKSILIADRKTLIKCVPSLTNLTANNIKADFLVTCSPFYHIQGSLCKCDKFHFLTFSRKQIHPYIFFHKKRQIFSVFWIQ